MTESNRYAYPAYMNLKSTCNDPRCVVCVPEARTLRDVFPSLSLMSKPITPAPPRLRYFPGYRDSFAMGKWRCRVELNDILRVRSIGGRADWRGPSLDDYRATGPEGWGDTFERAYNAWKSKWRACMENKT